MSTRPRILELRIEKLVHGGAGLGRHEGKVVFVPLTAPGDLVRARVVEEKKNYRRAALVEVLEPGEWRQEPVCRYFARCGGCQLQHLEYERQVEFKRSVLQELFHHHLPHTKDVAIRMRPSPKDYGYRSRARLQLRGYGDRAKIGFYRLESHRVQDIESCPLLEPALDSALAAVREERRAASSDPGITEIDLISSPAEKRWTAQARGAETPARAPEETIMERTVGGHAFEISPATFFQANDFLLDDLMALALEMTEGAGSRAALDLYSGIGFFSLPLARRFAEVTSVEISEAAARLCARNAAKAGLTNVRAVHADAEEWMRALSSVAAPAYDVVLLDPPRAGAGAEVSRMLVEWAPERVIYVSCDPHTLVRDLSVLVRHYEIRAVEGLDLFPQTYHIETAVRLDRR